MCTRMFIRQYKCIIWTLRGYHSDANRVLHKNLFDRYKHCTKKPWSIILDTLNDKMHARRTRSYFRTRI